MATNTDGLNEYQQRRLSVTCRHIDKLLSDIEAVLWASASKSPFPKYISDISPAQRRVSEDYIARIRARLVRTLESQDISIEPPSIPATRTLYMALTFVDISVEELRPRYMRGYGEVSPAAATELNGIVGELEGLVNQLNIFIGQASVSNLQQRIEALESAGTDTKLLKSLERIIGERGLVEFRSTLSMILERLEDKRFEIAIFGRASSGKSSLLNHMLQNEVLPVGVTPITALPTRLVFGEAPAIQVWYADNRASEAFGISRLAEFVVEEHNPGNAKHVSRVVVQFPSAALRDGIVFVDTPGLGSLATSGAAETIAYLPRCDLGVVLIDAGSTLTPDDLQTIQALYQAGIPANVLLSKADLLTDSNRAKMIGYAREHIRSELNLDITVHPVSVLPGHEPLFQAWLKEDIAPLFERRQELKLRSLQRKIGMLRESVGAALRARITRAEHTSSAITTDTRVLDANFRQATARIEETETAAKRIVEDLSKSADAVLDTAAQSLVEAWASADAAAAPDDTAVRNAVQTHTQTRVNAVQELLSGLAQDLASVLNDTAQDLQIANAPAAEEFDGVLREMPAFDPSPFRLRVSPPTIASLLGKGMAQRATQRQLRERIGSKLADALDTYGGLLRSWLENVIAHLHRRFEAYAGAYRAQLERTFAGGDASGDEKRGIEADLKELGMDTDATRPAVHV
ncbi:MAG: dynamin family protein [Acidobacteriia bacterium]|nr:dynamin family protein [Terriglobia bacterium]